MAESVCLRTLAYRDDDLSVLMRIDALALVHCRAVLKIVDYVLGYRLGLGRNDGECLAHIHRVENIVYDEHLREETEHSVKTYGNVVVNHEGRQRDKEVAGE